MKILSIIFHRVTVVYLSWNKCIHDLHDKVASGVWTFRKIAKKGYITVYHGFLCHVLKKQNCFFLSVL